MSSRFVGMLVFVAMVVGLAQMASAEAITVGNASFENKTVTVNGPNYTSPFGSFVSAANVAPWVFAASEGGLPDGTYDGIIYVAAGGPNATSPDWFMSNAQSNQAAFMEIKGTFYQVLSGFEAGTATVSFYASGTTEAIQTAAGVLLNPFNVKLDGTVLTFGGESIVTPEGGVFNLYTSDPIAVTAGSHTLAFAGLADADAFAFIDNVSVDNQVVPEPSMLALVTAGLFGLLAYAWRKRK